MRILFGICHYFSPDGGRHASLATNPKPRIAALTRQITALHQLYGPGQCILDITTKTALPAGHAEPSHIDVVVCTTKGRHLLGSLPLPPSMYSERASDAAPMFLGYECQELFRERLGGYDYYCYLEDDLILHDPWFFYKIGWFSRNVGNVALLQPNRYEAPATGAFKRVYVDGETRPQVTARFQDVSVQPEVKARILDLPVSMRRVRNPHSGCYFLNAAQMEHWTRQPYFCDRADDFISPLESAASLGIMRTFRVYKPAPANAAFLEIEHAGTGFASLIGNQIAIHPSLKPA
ncbi:MAG: hypothetical protein AB7E47_11805 [Desulfovibrionaceae bacterium]